MREYSSDGVVRVVCVSLFVIEDMPNARHKYGMLELTFTSFPPQKPLRRHQRGGVLPRATGYEEIPTNRPHGVHLCIV
jgi:hypothetical protein